MLTLTLTLVLVLFIVTVTVWQVELFFKWIKQHLRIKKFYGTTQNAVKTQITALSSTGIRRSASHSPGVKRYIYMVATADAPVFRGISSRTEVRPRTP